MRKFEFKLQSLLRVKELLEKQLMGELGVIEKKVFDLNLIVDTTYKNINEYASRYNELVNKGTDMDTINTYKNYFIHLNKLLKETAIKLEAANKEKVLCQQKIEKVMSERKAIENLKENQYKEYLVELQLEQDKAIDDIISYKTNIAGIEDK